MPEDITIQQVNSNPNDLAHEIYKKSLELYKQQKRVEQLLYKVSEIVFAFNANGEITLTNNIFESIVGRKPEAILGKRFEELIQIKDSQGNSIDTENIKKTRQEINETESIYTIEHHGKTIYVHMKVSDITGDLIEHEYLVTLTDITKEIQLDKQKDEFIYITSHELKTPMSIVKSYLWMVMSERAGALNSKQKEYLTKAMNGAERMINLIADILNVSRLEQGKLNFAFENFEYTQTTTEIYEALKLKAKEKLLEMTLNIKSTKKSIYTDKQKFGEIITNLLGNSVKYTEKGQINLTVQDEGDYFVKFIISDTGRGIDPEEIKTLFNKFHRLDNSYQTVAESGGTGLGLYIVKLYVSSLGGSLGVESEGKGKGASFWVTFPLTKEQVKDLGKN